MQHHGLVHEAVLPRKDTVASLSWSPPGCPPKLLTAANDGHIRIWSPSGAFDADWTALLISKVTQSVGRSALDAVVQYLTMLFFIVSTAQRCNRSSLAIPHAGVFMSLY